MTNATDKTKCVRHLNGTSAIVNRIYGENTVVGECREGFLFGKFHSCSFPDRMNFTNNVPLADRIPARLVLYFLSWSGFLVSFMMRNDINIALVTMVRLPTNETANTTNSENSTTTNAIDGEFEWSTMVQSIILGSFYCCYVLSQVRNECMKRNRDTAQLKKNLSISC